MSSATIRRTTTVDGKEVICSWIDINHKRICVNIDADWWGDQPRPELDAIVNGHLGRSFGDYFNWTHGEE